MRGEVRRFWITSDLVGMLPRSLPPHDQSEAQLRSERARSVGLLGDFNATTDRLTLAANAQARVKVDIHDFVSSASWNCSRGGRLSAPVEYSPPSEAVAQSSRVGGRIVRWRREHGGHGAELLDV